MIDPRVAGGLRDLPPSVMIPRERMLHAFRQTFGRFGYVPIETPHIERMEVLTGKGAGSEEVLRQIFDVTNKGGTPGELALRFDLTVPLARFIAKHVDELGVPFKRYAIGSVFRGERPAKGRFREFMQCDFDTVGTESPLADAETAQVIHAALTAAGVPAFTIALNNRKILDSFIASLGVATETDENGDVISREFKAGHILRSIDKRDKLSRDELFTELMARFKWGWKPPETQVPAQGWIRIKPNPEFPHQGSPILSENQANKVLAFLDNCQGGVEVLDHAEQAFCTSTGGTEGIENLRTVLKLLEASGVGTECLKIDLGLARGLDYYTGVVFETTVVGWERFGSIASGGRYDNLASLFTTRRLPGVGASIGLDRLLALMDEAKWLESTSTTAPVLVANFPGGDPATCARLAARLRAVGIGVEVYPDAIQLGKQLQYGSSRGHQFAVIVGPDEQEKATFNLRDLATRQERKGLPWQDLETAVSAALLEAKSRP